MKLSKVTARKNGYFKIKYKVARIKRILRILYYMDGHGTGLPVPTIFVPWTWDNGKKDFLLKDLAIIDDKMNKISRKWSAFFRLIITRALFYRLM